MEEEGAEEEEKGDGNERGSLFFLSHSIAQSRVTDSRQDAPVAPTPTPASSRQEKGKPEHRSE